MQVYKTIYKYRVAGPLIDFETHEGAEVLYFGNQDGLPTVWVLVDTEAPMVTRRVAVVGTGNMIPEYDNMRYVGTAMFDGGTFVFHAFDLGETPTPA